MDFARDQGAEPTLYSAATGRFRNAEIGRKARAWRQREFFTGLLERIRDRRVVYCGSGYRSSTAASILEQVGLRGTQDWEGLPPGGASTELLTSRSLFITTVLLFTRKRRRTAADRF